MSISSLKRQGVKLPPPEDADGLSANDVLGNMARWLKRFEDSGEEWLELDFIELLTNWPRSMLAYNMGYNLQLIAALIFLNGEPKLEELLEYEKQMELYKKEPWRFVSEPEEPKGLWTYDLLAIVFNRSKSSIFEAVRKKEPEARKLLEEASLQEEAHKRAVDELVKEEKERLKQQKDEETSKTDRTNDKT